MGVPVLAGFGTDGRPDADVAARAARSWLAGGIVGLPTETVYGLAADAQDLEAVARVYRAKGRPADHPLIVHVQGPVALSGWSALENPAAVRLAQAFWPGPLTVIVARSHRAGDFITGGQGTVALRCPDHPVARACIEALARESGDPARGVAAPSANRFGRVSPTSAADVVAEVGARMDPELDLVIDGGACAVGVESTIVDCTTDPPRVLRPGAISQAQVDAVLAGGGGVLAASREPGSGAGAAAGGQAAGAAGTTSETDQTEVRAPGTLDSHYSPHARVVLVEPAGRGADPELEASALRALAGIAVAGPAAVGGAGSGSGSGAASVGGGGSGAVSGAGSGAASVGLIAGAATPTPAGMVRVASPTTAQEFARELYAALRRVDELGLDVVLVVQPDPSDGPLAHAVRDRLARAAHPG